MVYEMIAFEKADRVATITLARPEKQNALHPQMWSELDSAVADAQADAQVRVIVLQGAGDSFCAGFDFSDGLAHYDHLAEQDYDPGMDVIGVTNPYTAPIPAFMRLWRCSKPVIAKVHGWCVGGGSEMALCADLVIASEDARLGTPYARVWGCHLTGMWIYRLGLTRAKFYALTGESLSGCEAAEIGLVNFAYPLEELDERTRYWAERLAQIPLTQLAAMKLIVNQAYDNMGLQGTQYLGTILDGIMRNTPEGRQFVRTADEQGVRAAVAQRDAPFGDYSQAPADQKPRRRGS
ncbi:MAG: enoyl-CoA hydratase [Planctomycetota bacterium]|nr:MAG: enoyl-CoA hydratase [Planctomycetota bacterium]